MNVTVAGEGGRKKSDKFVDVICEWSLAPVPEGEVVDAVADEEVVVEWVEDAAVDHPRLHFPLLLRLDGHLPEDVLLVPLPDGHGELLARVDSDQVLPAVQRREGHRRQTVLAIPHSQHL